jgi:hypothetical protein
MTALIELDFLRLWRNFMLRWLDDVLQDLKTLKVTAWWKKAQDRDSWKAVIKEAKAHKGL